MIPRNDIRTKSRFLPAPTLNSNAHTVKRIIVPEMLCSLVGVERIEDVLVIHKEDAGATSPPIKIKISRILKL